MKKINILAVANGVGISRDVDIIKRLLKEEGHDVEYNHTFRPKPFKHRHDLNIHLERFDPNNFTKADINIMIPNQEWFDKSWLPFLPAFDQFLTKTQFADKIFSSMGCKTTYIGFTSEDRLIQPTVAKSPFHWVHIAGKSIQKQTEVVIRTWQKNPGFPQLTLIQDPKFWKPRTPTRNINFMVDRVPEEVLKAIQNTNMVHICPSETEGFGHYIMEAMSAKGIVLATDGEPMNELVTAERGMLIRPIRSEPMNLSTKYIVDEKSLEETVVKTMVMDEGKKIDIGNAAREFYLHNDTAFKSRFITAIRSMFAQ